MRRYRSSLLALALAFAWPLPGIAWMRLWYNDSEVVERSPLIVVGHLKRESIQRFYHQATGVERNHDGASWEHHATLVVSKVLKGTLREVEIPIVLHYGLEPILGWGKRHGVKNASPRAVALLDTRNSIVSFNALIDDLGEDAIWFLRRLSREDGKEVETGPYGIRDPEDVRPAMMKEYVLAHLSKNPEAAIRRFVRQHPDQAGYARATLGHFEIERIRQIPDLEVRAGKLLPFYLELRGWYGGHEANAPLLECGAAAGRLLLGAFGRPEGALRRNDIIRFWGQVRTKEATPILVDLLLAQDRYWATQKADRDPSFDWRTGEGGDREGQKYELRQALEALRSIADRSAKEALELTRERWQPAKLDDPGIVELCDKALEKLKEDPGRP